MNAILDFEELRHPVEIAPNLQAGVRVADHWITVGYSERPGDSGRTRYRWEIIFPDNSDESGDDLQSGCQGGDLTEGLGSLLSFLGAAAESRQYRESTGREGENEDMFPAKVVEFASQYSDEITMLAIEVEESR